MASVWLKSWPHSVTVSEPITSSAGGRAPAPSSISAISMSRGASSRPRYRRKPRKSHSFRGFCFHDGRRSVHLRVVQESLWHERRSAFVLDQGNQKFHRLGTACVPVNDM